MLSKEARRALIGWEYHAFRIIKASFKANMKGITINDIQCYAATNVGSGGDLLSISRDCLIPNDIRCLAGRHLAAAGRNNLNLLNLDQLALCNIPR
ncbi:unnamed protein product [Schistosoma curassoni]|uniref:Pentapeptide repeat-containing protein n=1 Tax=Schistosoma curassoni TaxID=6186 RepID=A0A183KV09_9TREM|nr:unnamed protein product [Schistosoma curassoni]